MSDFPFAEHFQNRTPEPSLSDAGETNLAEYYMSKSQRVGDFYWKEAQRITGVADYYEDDAGNGPKQR